MTRMMNRKTEDNGLKPMKLRHLLVLLFLPALVSAETIDSSDLVERNGVFYKKFMSVPFPSRTRGIQKATYKDGKRHGPFEWYHENGQLKAKWTYKDGKKHGPYEGYHENGQVHRKGISRNGETVYETCFTETGKTEPCD